MGFAALIPGLKVSVDGVRDECNRIVAKSITFSGHDLQTAETLQAGLAPTQGVVETNQQNVEAKSRLPPRRKESGRTRRRLKAFLSGSLILLIGTSRRTRMSISRPPARNF